MNPREREARWPRNEGTRGYGTVPESIVGGCAEDYERKSAARRSDERACSTGTRDGSGESVGEEGVPIRCPARSSRDHARKPLMDTEAETRAGA